MTKILEMYGISTKSNNAVEWANIAQQGYCPYLGRKCYKTRKSNPNITIGTCTVTYGKEEKDVIICPARLLERRQIFTDCLHLLTLHEPGNELHIIPEVGIPGGSIICSNQKIYHIVWNSVPALALMRMVLQEVWDYKPV